MSIEDWPLRIRDLYEIHEWKHATAILRLDFQQEWQDIIDVLATFHLWQQDILLPGGRKS